MLMRMRQTLHESGHTSINPVGGQEEKTMLFSESDWSCYHAMVSKRSAVMRKVE